MLLRDPDADHFRFDLLGGPDHLLALLIGEVHVAEMLDDVLVRDGRASQRGFALLSVADNLLGVGTTQVLAQDPRD